MHYLRYICVFFLFNRAFLLAQTIEQPSVKLLIKDSVSHTSGSEDRQKKRLLENADRVEFLLKRNAEYVGTLTPESENLRYDDITEAERLIKLFRSEEKSPWIPDSLMLILYGRYGSYSREMAQQMERMSSFSHSHYALGLGGGGWFSSGESNPTFSYNFAGFSFPNSLYTSVNAPRITRGYSFAASFSWYFRKDFSIEFSYTHARMSFKPPSADGIYRSPILRSWYESVIQEFFQTYSSWNVIASYTAVLYKSLSLVSGAGVTMLSYDVPMYEATYYSGDQCHIRSNRYSSMEPGGVLRLGLEVSFSEQIPLTFQVVTDVRCTHFSIGSGFSSTVQPYVRLMWRY
jgi:hypothetical protein